MKKNNIFIIAIAIILVIYFYFFGNKSVNIKSFFIKDTKIESVESLKKFMEDGQKSGYFPKKVLYDAMFGPQKITSVNLDSFKIMEWSKNSKCLEHKNQIILATNPADHSIFCVGSSVVIAGDGNDKIDSVSSGNHIYCLGKGDDTIHSSGHNIIIFQKNWGHDTVNIHSREVDTTKIQGYDGSYPWRYSSFLVFDKGIHRADIRWEGNKLINIKTGDSIEINTKKVNLLFADEKNYVNVDGNYVKKKFEPKKVTLDKLRSESVLVKGNYFYSANGNDGLDIVDVSDILNPIIIYTVPLPGRALSVKIEDNIAYVAQGDFALEGRKGWVSIIDVSNPTNPKLLKNLSFGNNIFSVAVNDDTLYVPDTAFFDEKDRYLHTYDVSNPAEPVEVSKLKLNHYTQFIVYLNKTLYISDFLYGFSSIDASNPKSPKDIRRYQCFKNTTYAVKNNKDYVAINFSGNVVGVYKPIGNNETRTKCHIYTSKYNTNLEPSSIDSIAIRDNILFREEGPLGVSVSDMESCKTLYYISSTKGASSIYIIENILVVFDRKGDNRFYNLDEIFPQYKNSKEVSSKIKFENATISKDLELNKNQLYELLKNARKKEEIIKLLKMGADPNYFKDKKPSPIEFCIFSHDFNKLELLLENGGKAEGKYMFAATKRGNIKAMEILEKYGATIDQLDDKGCSILHYATMPGSSINILKHLVEKGAFVNAVCKENETPLTWAKRFHNKEAIEYLESVGGK